MPKPRTRSGEPRRPPRPDEAKPKTRARSRKKSRNLQFEATVRDEHLRLQITAPTRWIYIIVTLLGCAFLTVLSLLFPDWWPAIQAVLTFVTKLLATWK